MEPPNAVFALRLAMYELDKLVKNGMTQDGFREDAIVPFEIRQHSDEDEIGGTRLCDRQHVLRDSEYNEYLKARSRN